MRVSDLQNIFDVTLQNYGSLDFIVKLADDNDIQIDEAPPNGLEIIRDQTLGEQRVKQFVTENSFIYNNNVVEASAAIIANNDGDQLSPESGIIFIYK